MKKRIVILSFILCLAAAAGAIPSVFERLIPEATVSQINHVKYTESISATGEVNREGATGISSDMPLILDKVLIARGQTVSEGQAVATINKAATAKKMMESNQYAGLSALGAGNTITSYEDVVSLIPEKLYSSAAGTVDSVNAGDGDYLSAGTSVVNLIGSEDLIVTALISEKNISKVKTGQTVLIGGSGFGNKTYTGIVEEISSTAKKQYVGTAQDTVVETKIRFTDADENIRAGYSAKIKVLTSDTKTISVIPYEAINADGNGNEYVYVFGNGIAVKKDIATGIELSDGVEVLSGIGEDDYILTSASDENIKNGSYVKIKEE